METLVLELIKQLELNTTTLWVDSLENTLECVVLETLPKVNDNASDEEGNVHSYDKIPQGNQFTGDRIGVLIKRIKESLLYPRRCTITGEGMNEGYRIGEVLIKYEEDLIKHLRSIDSFDCFSDEFLLKDYHDNGYYCHVEWKELDNYVNYTADGKEVFVED